MKVSLKKIPSRLVNGLFDFFSDETMLGKIFNVIAHRAAARPPEQALKFLFGLDALLYTLQTQTSIAYNGGLHPKHRLMNYHDFFARRIAASDRVMDIGCGLGAVAYDVAQVSKQVVGMDLNAKSIQKARELYQRPNLEFRVGDALKTLPDEKYDVVILSNVLEHLTGRPEFLRRVQAVLKPERILIRVPLFERDWRVPLKKELGVEWRLDDTHEIEYTLETFAAEMNQAGLAVKHLEVRWGEIWTELLPSSNAAL
jgi:SAM-dependent methyltransferase